MRNFDPRFSKVKDDNSGKYHWLYLRKAELEENMKIPLSEFAVADWWRSSYNLSREQTHADLSNVTVLSFDFVDDISGGLQDIDIGNIQIVGDWVSKERWYLSIIVAWASFGTLFALWRLAYLTKKEQLQNDKIHDLLVKNSHLEVESSKFRKLSTVDALTNIFNRYGIEQIIIALETKRQSCAVIMFDIDNFKLVNDKRGHDCGDRVLQRVCEVIAANTRTVDIFGRWGGEEFILIFPNTAMGMGIALAEKLRLLICNSVFESNNPLAVSASFGVAALHENEGFSGALKRADTALYEAKNTGRNRVAIANGDSPF